MKNFERQGFKESLDKAITSIAHAYGFTNAPLSIPKKQVADSETDVETNTLLIASIASTSEGERTNVQSWGVLKAKGSSRVVFTITNPKHAIAQAFVIKASLATAETSGFSNCRVLISSIGDDESRRRYVREIGNFFKKNHKAITDEFGDLSAQSDPDAALKTILESDSPLKDSLPRTIDYLSEASRKTMLETISLLETLEISYELDPRLPYTPGINRELIFAIEGIDAKGVKHTIATGGCFQSEKKKKDSKKHEANIMGITISVPEVMDTRDMELAEKTACFVVHVGEAARLKSFTLLDSMWRAQISLGQAILMESIQKQMELAQESGAKYIAIVGQREALDGTAILKNVSTELQETLPVEKLISRLSRVRS